jgi:transcriptional regulator with XRE-family HTH domain
MQKILSANIARCRKEQGLTQEQPAAKLGITYQAISKWETGQTMPDFTLLPTLAHALNVSVDKLLGYDAGCHELSPYEEKYQKDAYLPVRSHVLRGDGSSRCGGVDTIRSRDTGLIFGIQPGIYP